MSIEITIWNTKCFEVIGFLASQRRSDDSECSASERICQKKNGWVVVLAWEGKPGNGRLGLNCTNLQPWKVALEIELLDYVSGGSEQTVSTCQAGLISTSRMVTHMYIVAVPSSENSGRGQ